MASEYREGSLEAPTRHPLNWKDADFYNEESLNKELERVFDICHGCRRCVSLCHAFPTLFDLVDESQTMEVDGVAKQDYGQVVEHCYLCDLCYLSKCPYVPPHEWNVDFPHLMLRAKAVKHKKGGSSFRDRVLSSTDAVGSLVGIPVVAEVVNSANKNKIARQAMDKVLGVHAEAMVPEYHSRTLRKRLAGRQTKDHAITPTGQTTGKVALFVTCYGNRNAPAATEDLLALLEHNHIPITLVKKEQCCGMPKMELGDLEAVQKSMQANIPHLLELVNDGWDLVAPVPSCVLMFKQELPLLFADDTDVQKVQGAFFDPFEYLMLRHREGQLKTDFKQSLGRVAYHVACHQRVQSIGLKTKEMLSLVPDTSIEVIERCSGHDGTYAVKSEFHAVSMKICRPVANRIKQAEADHYISDCPMAGEQIQNAMRDGRKAESPFTLLRYAYGI